VAGLVVLDTWTPNSAHVHVLVRTAAACRRLLAEALEYAFRHVGILLGVIRSSNERSLRLTRKVGFREVSRVVDGWQAGEDLIVFEMRREECRWIERAA
jgi:L-amino acid N-acyltransferase YncA